VFVQPSQPTNGLAIASLVVSLVWMWWIGSVLAIVFGHVALSQIHRSGGAQSGRGLAIAGLALGYFGATTLLAVLAWAVG
jgi:threonine/homoserine/homoserine lactone efflux protein